jgi:hypothetical protein
VAGDPAGVVHLVRDHLRDRLHVAAHPGVLPGERQQQTDLELGVVGAGRVRRAG